MSKAAFSATIFAVVTLAGGLAGCGGGSNEAQPVMQPPPAEEPPAADPPAETAAEFLARTDSLLISTLHGNTEPEVVAPFTATASCSGTSCSLTSEVLRDSTVGLDYVQVTTGGEAVGTRHGIELRETVSELEGGLNVRSLGAWLDHSAFGLVTQWSTDSNGVRIDARFGYALGDLTGSPPGSATWLGAMVGTLATGEGRGDRLQGIAALNYDMEADGGLDIAFSDITNIDRETAHSTPAVVFADVPIDSRGTFQTGSAGDRIQGGFYGPEHAEAAGIFEHSNIVGAFGAKKE